MEQYSVDNIIDDFIVCIEWITRGHDSFDHVVIHTFSVKDKVEQIALYFDVLSSWMETAALNF